MSTCKFTAINTGSINSCVTKCCSSLTVELQMLIHVLSKHAKYSKILILMEYAKCWIFPDPVTYLCTCTYVYLQMYAVSLTPAELQLQVYMHNMFYIYYEYVLNVCIYMYMQLHADIRMYAAKHYYILYQYICRHIYNIHVYTCMYVHSKAISKKQQLCTILA